MNIIIIIHSAHHHRTNPTNTLFPNPLQSQHFTGIQSAKESGLFQMGGAVLNEVPTSDDPKTFSFAGSTIVIQASSREEVVEILKQDIYAKSGVWDVDNVSLLPFSFS
jgi:uncharacterized protein YciI